MWILVFITVFLLMEFAAWALHKYVMHGFLWSLHEDHHVPHKKTFEKNDRFAIFFAVPSFLFILFGFLFEIPLLEAVGYGIMAYGFAYFFVHEVIIHRRLKFMRGRGPYFRALITAHKHHHLIRTKEGCKNFGMLVVHPQYFIDSFKHFFSRTKAS